MQIERNEQAKQISVWLTKADQEDPQLSRWLQQQYPTWKQQKYQTVVYRSGSEDLYDNTLALLKHNRILSARLEAEKPARRRSALER